MDDTFRREWVVQVAHERAAARGARTRPFAEDAAEAVERVEHAAIERPAGSTCAVAAGARRCRGGGSFVRAARRLGYSRSTISHQIAQLELAVGTSLVTRGSGSRSVTVTPRAGSSSRTDARCCACSRTPRASSPSSRDASAAGGRQRHRSPGTAARRSRTRRNRGGEAPEGN